jgi:hypothetical protein
MNGQSRGAQRPSPIPPLADQMTPTALTGRNNPQNLPTPLELQGRIARNPYGDAAVPTPGIPFRVSSRPMAAMEALRAQEFRQDLAAIQHAPQPWAAPMGGGEKGDPRAGVDRGMSRPIARGVTFSLGGNRGRMGGGSLI